jgi:hypothetical protein
MALSIRDQLSPHRLRLEAQRHFGRPDPRPYIAHKDLLKLAKAHPPKCVAPKVTSFSDWVLGLYYSARDPFALEFGRDTEIAVVSSYSTRYREAKNYLANRAPEEPEWELEYIGISKSAPSYLVSSLTINGQPLAAKPDRVLKHIQTSTRRVVEIKGTRSRRPIPPFGWPNLKVQLWCYGLIDQWLDAPEVLLNGEIWVDVSRSSKRTLTRSIRDPHFHAECCELFELFGGRVHSNISVNTDRCKRRFASRATAGYFNR